MANHPNRGKAKGVTSSPWRIGDAGFTVFGPPNGNPSPETVANCKNKDNARLIAAAPDLLAAMQALFEHCVMTHKHWGEGCNQREADAAQVAAQAAIAKATQS